MRSLPSIIMLLLLGNISSLAQDSSKFAFNKPGKWNVENNYPATTPEQISFRKNIEKIVNAFRVNTTMLLKPTGYDMHVFATYCFDDYYKKSEANYALRAEVAFNFQLLFNNGGKWSTEPPTYTFHINNTHAAPQSHFNLAYYDNLKDDPKLKNAINTAAKKINEIFTVFPFKTELAKGVNVYEEYSGSPNNYIVVFNPNRPAYWKSVSVKELADMYLDYYSINQKTELDKEVLQELKREIGELSEEELQAPAYSGHDTHILFQVNGQKKGLQFMRFNTNYWDRSLPVSAIQFMTFFYPQFSGEELDTYMQNNGHPNYEQLLVNQIKWQTIAEEIIN